MWCNVYFIIFAIGSLLRCYLRKMLYICIYVHTYDTHFSARIRLFYIHIIHIFHQRKHSTEPAFGSPWKVRRGRWHKKTARSRLLGNIKPGYCQDIYIYIYVIYIYICLLGAICLGYCAIQYTVDTACRIDTASCASIAEQLVDPRIE